MNGIKLDSKKNYLISWAIHTAKIPSRIKITIPSAMDCVVRSGEEIKTGQILAQPLSSEQVYRHSPVTGRIVGIQNHIVEIETHEKEIWIQGAGTERPNWSQLSQEELFKIFQESGLVTLDSSLQALHTKISRQQCAQEDFLILNACESEPYVSSLQSLVMSHPLEVLKGADILRKVYGAGKIKICVEENKEETIELLKSKVYFLKWEHIEIQALPSHYPQDQDSLIFGKTHSKKTDNFDAIENAATAFAVYEAVVKQKPLIERVVTVAGECVPEAKNVWIRLGISLEDAFKNAKGFLREPRKVVLGGPMRGISVLSLEARITPDVDAVLALPPEVVEEAELEPCTRCGRCIESCPVDIIPSIITMAAEEDDFETAEYYEVDRCTECGNCAYVCPAKRPMTELLRYAKERGQGFKKLLIQDDVIKNQRNHYLTTV